MTRRVPCCALIALCGAVAWIGAFRPGTSDAAAAARPGQEPADATSLYNAGTVALTRGEVGPAVTFLLAAARLEPRAPDVRANLARAVSAAALAAGEEERGDQPASSPFPLATEEAWWIAAALLAAGAGVGIARAMSRLSEAARWAGAALVVTGVLVAAWLHREAWEEAAHPEAVVIATILSVERGPEEPSRPAVLLSSGERVRLGQMRGGLVEIRVGENRIGWAAREGLWRVADAPRYTSGFEPR